VPRRGPRSARDFAAWLDTAFDRWGRRFQVRRHCAAQCHARDHPRRADRHARVTTTPS